MFCPNCGKQIPDEAKFCTECGWQVGSEYDSNETASHPAQSSQPVSSQPQQAAPAQPSLSQAIVQQAASQGFTQPVNNQPINVQPQQSQPVNVQPQQGQPVNVQPQQGQPVYAQPAGGQPQQYQQPMGQPQPSYQVHSSQAPMQGQQQGAKKSSSKALIPILIAVAVAVVGLVVFFVIRGRGGADKKYDTLCELTAHGTDSYVYARMLTEQLLQTDLMAADPDTVVKTLDECVKTWDAVGRAAGKIVDLAEEVGEDSGKITGSHKFNMPGTLTVYADDAESVVESMQTVEESIVSCTTLGQQYFRDASNAVSEIQTLQAVYHGRSTSVSEWSTATQSVSQTFHTEIMVCGEMVVGNGTTGTPSSIHTLSRTAKSGAVSIGGASTVVSVSEESSTIIVGESDNGVVFNRDEIERYVDDDSSVVAVSSRDNSGEGSRISFHSESLMRWFFEYRVSGYQITRGNKGNAIQTPEVETESVPIPEGEEEDPVDIIWDPIGTLEIAPPVRLPIIDWTDLVVHDSGDSGDITRTTNDITGEEGNNPESSSPNEVPTESSMNNSLTNANAGVGKITVSLGWGSYDDIDLHMDTPDGSHIYYRNKTAGGGELDVDMNASSSDLRSDPVENIYFGQPEAGHYKVYIKNFRDRTEGQATHYMVRVTVDDETKVFEGTIDDTDTEIVIYEFDYAGSSEPATEVNEDTLDRALNLAGAGEGDITVSLLWDTYDDVDLHMITPDESHISYNNKSAGGGTLDVDANAASRGDFTVTPVENIYFADPQNGHYKVYIHQYCDRTDNQSSHYLVRVTVGDRSQTFEGTIDTTGTEIPIVEFDYGGGRSGQYPNDASTFNDHHYAYYPQMMTWLEARDFCVSLGGHLATITSADEQNFIEETFPGNSGWLGGYGDVNADASAWKWVTNEPMNYSNWASGEPNKQGGDEWCMHLYSGMQWNDLPNDDTSFHTGFICEWDDMDDIFNEDTMNETLQDAGAQSGALTISMMWNTQDDLDLHVFTPAGNELYYEDSTVDGGELDVDMRPHNEDCGPGPYVENVFFENPEPGDYSVVIYDYDDYSDGPTDYMVKVTVDGESRTYEGTIDGTDSYIDIITCRYGN